MHKSLKIFTTSFAGLFVYCAAVYVLLRDGFGLDWVFGAWYRMFLYHYQHPFQYIAVFCIVYAAVLALLLQCWPGFFVRQRWALVGVALVSTVLLASVLGGALWKLHDMQAGYFTEGSRFWGDIWWGVSGGLELGWLLLLLSFPFNLLCLPAFVIAAYQSSKLYARLRGDAPT